MILKHNISFRLDNHPDQNGEVSILMVLTYRAKRVTFTSGLRINPENWDRKLQQPKKTSLNASGQDAIMIRTMLSEKVNTLEKVFTNLAESGGLITTKEIREQFLALVRPSENVLNTTPTTVLEWMNLFVAEMSILREWTDSTREKFHALAGHIAAVDPKMTLEDLDENGLTKLLEHFRSVILPGGVKGMRNSTIKKQYGYLSWFLNWTVRKGITTNVAFKSFSPALKHTTKKVVYLTEDELIRVNNVDLEDTDRKHLERIRDIFLFQCYSGLRYSDVANLRWSDIKTDALVITTIKTMDTITIELNSFTREIIEKYRPFQFPDDKVFPAPTNQEANRYVKDLCRYAEIDEPMTIIYYKGKERVEEIHPKYELISTHAGRRTFVVRALSRGISPYIVMRWTGHSSLTAMKPYMDIVDTAKADAMRVFDNQ